MGKKKIGKKTKELSVAIAESSSGAPEQHQQQSNTPRKRGRPRKIVEKTASEEIKEEHTLEAEAEVGEEREKKKAKMSEEEEVVEEEKQQVMKKEEATPTDTKKEAPRSRARRKNKPRKSS